MNLILIFVNFYFIDIQQPQNGHLYNMRRIGEIIDETGLEIEKLDAKLDKVLEKNEKDFLTAYRFHMLKV